ncbi:Nuclear migration protein [Geosmithia morbida]|uniref:Nuclear migration protein n=1 Tax=Geosmithia morbida TaxID=1094350 RepID=A0A9P4Z188_9HYPO|nr:Nuclear migration protein [Geosmithia morbida]KAF4126267.1 Nuclear migration protein [Geosmithia morbida]
MADWDDDYLSGPATASLPLSTQSTPANKMNRRSLTPPPRVPSSPPPMHSERKDRRHSKRTSRDITNDDSISILDPRRFTPTLHANLVSEILSLRRDQEEKIKLIESLEHTLSISHKEQEDAVESFSVTAKENRSLKRQLALLEGGTSSALGELARERDEAVEASADARKRLETAQKKIRTQDEDSQRVHDQWAREKDDWDEERRKFERKLHVAESRLRVVLDEVAAFQAAQANGAAGGNESDVESGRENDGGSVRSMSVTNSIRFSYAHPNRGSIISKIPGNTLADELDLDDDDETDWDGRESVFSGHTSQHGHARNFSRDSVGAVGPRHVRNQSIDSLKRPGSMVRGKIFMNPSVLEALEGEEEEVTIMEKPTYTDTGVQYTPPPSPVAQAADPEPEPEPEPELELELGPEPETEPETPTPPMKLAEDDGVASPPRGDSEAEADRQRKRVQLTSTATRTVLDQPPTEQPPPSKMVSSSSQTVEEPISPPDTPRRPATPEEETAEPPVIMITTSTQTEEPPAAPQPEPEPEPEPESESEPEEPAAPSPPRTRQHLPRPSPSPPPIPSISIQPPTSRPTTPREPRLPPLSKHFGCQVNMPLSATTSDACIQTEGIQVDKRLAKLPAHLQPSSITSRPSSPNPVPAGADMDRRFNAVPSVAPPRNPRRLAKAATVTAAGAGPTPTDQQQQPPVSPSLPPPGRDDDELRDSYPGNNDNGPLSDDRAAPKRPHRFSSLFAGFDTASSDEAEFADEDNSDSEFRTALSAPRPQSISSRGGARSPTDTLTSPTSPDRVSMRQAPRNSVRPIAAQVYGSYSSIDGRSSPSNNAPGGTDSSSAMRKAAVIQSGMASHMAGGRSRSPSLPDARYPPFPIPARASSRKPISSAPTSEGRRSPTRVDGWQRRNARTHVYRPSTSSSLRKTRSAATLPRQHGSQNQRYRRHGSKSPPPLSPSTEAPESPGLPPLPRNDITTPRNRRSRGNSHYRRHRPRASNTTDKTNVTSMTNGTYATNMTNGTNGTNGTNATDPVSVISGASNGVISNGGSQTSVVDAIAQCMVGEWMFKYVRRRKSFNVPETNGNGKDDSGNDRHRRWVWLAPYERAILWSSKQPSSGSALMGKAGRKLMIQSVLDVKDDNAAPKGFAGGVFNRSVLILTPQRALKFTATSAERHYVWLTALSFLAHSSQAVPEIVSSPLPQRAHHKELLSPATVAMDDGAPAPSLPKAKRSGIRDSIRLAKGRGAGGGMGGGPVQVPSEPPIPSIPTTLPEQMSDATNAGAPPTAADFAIGAITTSHTRDQSYDTAEPPMIPRFQERANQTAVHGRKRSNTGGHVPPPLSFRGFSGPAPSLSAGGSSGHRPTGSTAGASIGTAGSSDYSYQSQSQTQSQPSQSQWGMSSQAGGSSQRTSEASSRPSNFFDAIGTVRMEAFISPLGPSQFGDYPDEQDELRQVARRRSKELRRRQSRRSGSRTRDSGSYYSYGSRARGGSSTAGGEEDYFRDDPFRGF